MPIGSKYLRDYKNSDYRNPRILRQKEALSNRIHILFRLLILSAIGGIVYIVLFSPYFKINNIEIIGLEKIDRNKISSLVDQLRAKKIFSVIPFDNIFIFNSSELQSLLEKDYLFQSLKFEKKLPKTIILTIEEKKTVAYWLNNDFCFNLDSAGTAIGYCTEKLNYVVVRDLQMQTIELGDRAVDTADLNYIIELNERFKNLIGSYKLTFPEIERSGSSLSLKSVEGVMFKFNRNLSLDDQLNRLSSVLEYPEVKNKLQKINYIDLRFGEKIYYK